MQTCKRGVFRGQLSPPSRKKAQNGQSLLDRVYTLSAPCFLPLVITHGETTSAPVSDDAMTAAIHAELERKALLPAEHIVDTGEASTGKHQGIFQGVLQASRDRGHHLTRGSHDGFASFPLHWAGEDTLATSRHGCRSQPHWQSGMGENGKKLLTMSCQIMRESRFAESVWQHGMFSEKP
jgi:hypothetical protein